MPSSTTSNRSTAQRPSTAHGGASEALPTTPKELSNFFSALKSTHAHQDVAAHDDSAAELPPLPSDDDSFLRTSSDDGELSSQRDMDESNLDESGIRQKLSDVESSFLPEPSPETNKQEATGTDDTFLFGRSPGYSNSVFHSLVEPQGTSINFGDASSDALQQDYSNPALSPSTPSSAYQTPAPIRSSPDIYEEADDDETPKNSHIYSGPTANRDTITSSPAAAAAERTMFRAMAVGPPTNGTLAEMSTNIKTKNAEGNRELDSGPSMSRPSQSSLHSTVKPLEKGTEDDQAQNLPTIRAIDQVDTSVPPPPLRPRPSFLQSRHGSQRSSRSSFTNRSDISSEAASEATLGADYALQTGGALPSSSSSRPSHGLSRLPSLGSVASSVSAFSEVTSPQDLPRTLSNLSMSSSSYKGTALTKLAEEQRKKSASPPETPRPGTALTNITDTVITQHVQNIHVPDTVARQYRQRHRSNSPDKQQAFPTPFGGRGKPTLTLKEQNSRMDKLSKENFDLKLKIHYLDQALQTRSDEGVKEMISKSVQLQTDLVNAKKDNQALRRKVRELEEKLKEQKVGSVMAKKQSSGSDDEKNVISPVMMEMEEEIIFLKEKLEQLEGENETLKSESIKREMEKRRLTDYVKSMGEQTASEANAGVEETMEMWKDLLQAETSRREQADDDALKLREEIARLRNETFSSAPTNNLVKNIYRVNSRNHISYSRSHSRSGGSDKPTNVNPAISDASSTLVETLKHENAELRRDLGAQTSMLTSRNRERERLQAEIENLKLAHRKGDAVLSSAGDSIFERSISRQYQRSGSRGSGRTRASQLSDAEREEYERKEASLRDDLVAFKMENQELDRELNGHVDQLEALEEKLRSMTETLQAIQAERDEALVDFESLRQQAQENLDEMDNELGQRELQIQELEQRLATEFEDKTALQHEVRNVSNSVVRLEDAQEAHLTKIERLQNEIQDANTELEVLDKKLLETTQKKQRLEVQEESNRDEIKFLREEQEGDKIKIGELESALRIAESRLQDESNRVKVLEQRLAEQRRQRDLLETQDKQDFQRVLDDLKTQAEKSREEVDKLRKSLQSKEDEASTLKDHLDELEANLRQVLGNKSGSRSGLLKDITRVLRDLDWTAQELDKTKADFLEKERLLKARDTLLESTGLENRKLSELLEKERQGRKQDVQAFEADKRKNRDSGNVMHHHEARIQELELERNRDRKKRQTLERVYEDQLVERNDLLLALWSRLSTLCGPDWVKKYAYVNGEVPSIDVIARDYAGFCKNLVHALKTVEGLVSGFKSKISGVEQELWSDYQAVEQALSDRMKRLDQVEKLVASRLQAQERIPSRSSSRTATNSDPTQGSKDESTIEVARLRSELDMLKAEIRFHRAGVPSRSATQQIRSNALSESETERRPASDGGKRESMIHPLFRHHSTAGLESASQTPTHDQETHGTAGHLQPPPLVHGHTAPIGHNFSPNSKKTIHISEALKGPPVHSTAAGTSRAVSAPHPDRDLRPPPQRQSSVVEKSSGTPGEKEKSDRTWVHRLREMERRLRAEREGRLLDRSGARKRLEQGRAEKEELKRELEREKIRRETVEMGVGNG